MVDQLTQYMVPGALNAECIFFSSYEFLHRCHSTRLQEARTNIIYVHTKNDTMEEDSGFLRRKATTRLEQQYITLVGIVKYISGEGFGANKRKFVI